MPDRETVKTQPRDLRHDETWKLETQPTKDITSRQSQDWDMEKHVSRQSRDNTCVSRLHHCMVTIEYDLYVLGQHGVLCEIKWWRFVVLSEQN